MYDKNISPVGWYVGSYLIRFIELESQDNDDLEKKFLSWENTIIVKASNLDEAYNKVVEVAKLDTKPYKGGPKGVPVQWVFEGITELLPIYEELEDGAEIIWAEHKPKKLKNLRKLVMSCHELKQ
ncbi:hypothetical protein PN36_20445 [Candidatus Thiomargarita nelsonii]|uniref:DUF4288 domain-containing protein n=1 Tax=Candidatus Thiomargarita nelsonii TaxID=1003181 RepID=A0A0A6PBD8_9GAMM|nr:hypothetical protein PN36_20445 [Candidatus Thiomargarita nelsonii]